MNPALFSSASTEWTTPQWLFDALNMRFQFTVDVRFIAGRLRFGGAAASAPFPSAIAVWWGWPVLAGGFAG